MNAKKSWALLCLIVLCAMPNGRADLIDVDADSYVERNTETSNYGGSTVLRVKHDTSLFIRKAYIRFDLSTLSFDHTADLGSASLSLEFVDGAGGGGGLTNDWTFAVYGLNDNDPGEGWGESTVTWNNAPQNNTANGNGLLAGATNLGDFTFTGRTASIDFSNAAIRDFVAASTSDDLVTFVVVRDTLQPNATDNFVHAIASSENGVFAAPQLNLTQAIPEPSSLALLVFGLVGLRFARKT